MFKRLRFNDWPFSLKFGVAPALAVLALIGIALMGGFALNGVAKSQEETVERLTGVIALELLENRDRISQRRRLPDADRSRGGAVGGRVHCF
ncbi:hypothetical protein ABWI01_05950 [Oceanicaulis alexandrii]|uniref:hypothetical protein n=1 Tax=Oceanicaulis alexandrii TaxID=153233 RepID=UPI0035D08948